MNCLRCGATNPEGFHFCGSCGADLTAGPGREIRKTVTVLFADVTGSTAMAERLDPESLRHVMGRYFDEMRSVIERHGGTAEKFIGDAVMAVFGIPRLHEDDARRALHAASEMRERLSALNVDLERDFGVHIEARIGVNTGEVVTGEESSGQRLATGDAVNVAARLEQAAAPSEILLGHQTLALARDAVEVEPVDPLTLKGKALPVAAYRLLRVIEGAPAFDRRLDVPLVGRHEELARVRKAFEQTLAERRCRIVTVLGPPGIGKTRLAKEISADIRDSAVVLAGRCLPYGEGITYWPLREIFASAGAEDELEAALGAGGPEEIFYAVRKAIEGRARQRPLMLVVEDIHWAEPTLLELLEHLADWTRDAQLFLFCLARPELLDARPGWAGRANAETITLEPLPENETEQLIDRLLGGARLEEETRTRVGQLAEGNPLFVEQILAMLAEDGDPNRVPPTIQAVLAARLDALPDEDREILERASVVGLEFEWEALTVLGPKRRRPAGARLQSLIRKGLIRPQETTEDGFRFEHMLILDAAYDRIPKELRSNYHERFAEWLGPGEEFEEIVGYHLEQAHRNMAELGPSSDRTRSLGERAAELLLASGKRANARGDLPGAANLLERAAALLPRDDTRRLQLLPSLGRTLVENGRSERARAVLAQALDDARQAGDRAAAADASLELAFLRVRVGEATQQEVLPEIDNAVQIFQELGDMRRLARGVGVSGTMGYWRGEVSAIEDLERAARLAYSVGDHALEAMSIQYMLLEYVYGPKPVQQALDRLDELQARAGLHRGLATDVLRSRAVLEAMRGNFQAGRGLIAEAKSLSEELGFQVLVRAGIDKLSGYVETLAGDPVAAERELRSAIDGYERAGQWGHLITPAWRLAVLLCKQGRHVEAERLIDLTRRYSVPDDMDTEVGWRCALATLLSRRGERAEAERLAREAVKLAGGTNFYDVHAHAYEVLGDVLRLAGRHEESATARGEAIRLHKQKGNVAALALLKPQ